jgi:hypothetical protein
MDGWNVAKSKPVPGSARGGARRLSNGKLQLPAYPRDSFKRAATEWMALGYRVPKVLLLEYLVFQFSFEPVELGRSGLTSS